MKPDVGTALATWANAITAARLLLSPLMFWLIPDDDAGSWTAFAFWFLLSVSDFVDGFIARRRGPAGAFLDPLADKVLILRGDVHARRARRVLDPPVAIIAAGAGHQRVPQRDRHQGISMRQSRH